MTPREFAVSLVSVIILAGLLFLLELLIRRLIAG